MLAIKGAGPVTDSAVDGARGIGAGEHADPSSQPTTADQDHRELILAELRVLALRCKLVATEVDAIGVALKAGAISPETAVEWVHDLEEPAAGVLRSEAA